MILKNWLKRFRKGEGFSGMSAESWGRVCNIPETIEGLGCSFIKTDSGNGWVLDATGRFSDLPYPAGVTPTADQFPNGTEIPGEVWYDTISHKLKQHVLVWNSETRAFDESETSTDIATLYSHDLAHGVTE